MITIAVTKAYAIVTSRELLTSRMSNVAQVAFTFSSDWEGLNKTAVWTDGTVTVDVSDASWSNNICNIPHEVLTTSGRIVRVGIYGTDGSTTVLPTIWAELGRIRDGVDPSGDPSVTPTPTVQAQLLAAASAAGQAKTDALAAQAAAENAESTAVQAAATAETAREAAATARTASEAAEANASTSASDAEQYKAAAQQAAETAQAAATAMQECAAYSSTKSYAVGNMATYNGSTYRCTTACTGVAPTNTANWLLIAAKGTDGQGAGDMLASVYDASNKKAQIATESELTTHVNDKANPHGVTKSQAGLGNVDNVSVYGLLNRSTAVDVADTNYTTLMARGESLNSADTTPTVNSAICWTYG